MAIRTWSSAGSTDLNDAANYSGSGALLTTDDLVFDNTSVVNAIATANLDVNSITVAANYSGNMSFSGKTAIYENGNASFDGTGTLNLGNGITLNGASATFHIGSGVGVVTATSCVISMNGTTGMILDIDKASTYFKQLLIGFGANVTHSGAQAIYLQHTASPLIFVNGGTLVNNVTIVVFYLGSSGDMFSITGNPNISGTGPLTVRAATINSTVNYPAITAACPLTIFAYAASGTTTINQTGDIVCTKNVTILTNQPNTMVYNTNDNDISALTLALGVSFAGGYYTFNAGLSNISVSTLDLLTYAVGNNTLNFEECTLNCAGNITIGTNITINKGTSLITITDNSIITSNGQVLNDLVVNVPTANRKTFALNQTSRNYHGIAAHTNGNRYAIVNVSLNGVYMQTGGIGDFVLIWDVNKDFRALGIAPNGDVYVGEYGGSIYVQTGGIGDFNELSGTTGNWHGITVVPNGNVYAASYNGDIYKRTNGVGSFVALGQTSRAWRALGSSPANNNVYATIYGGDIYKFTNDSGEFTALNQSIRSWREINGDSLGNIFAVVNGGDIYKQTLGTGDFIATNEAALAWHGIDFDINDNMILCTYGGDIYEKNSGIILTDDLVCNNFTILNGCGLGGHSITCTGNATFSVSTTLYRLIMTKATTRSITVLASGTLTLLNLTASNLNGTSGALTQWRSSIEGTQFNLLIPEEIVLTFQNAQDCVSSQLITANDGTSSDAGNNVNWLITVIINSLNIDTEKNIINISQYIDVFHNVMFKNFKNENVNVRSILVNTAGFVCFYGVGYYEVDAKRIYLSAGKWHDISGIGVFLSSGTDKGIGIHVKL